MVYVQAMMTGSVIYQFMAMDLGPWVFQLIDRIRHGFLCAGKEDTCGGNCLVAWHRVYQPKALGSLGFHNLTWLNAVLCTRWIWIQQTSVCKPWLGLDVAMSNDAQALFGAAIRIDVGKGDKVLFWSDPWVDGKALTTIAPAILALVRSGPKRSRTVQQGLLNNGWVKDIVGTLTIDTVVQFLRVWHLLRSRTTRPAVDDTFSWKFSADSRFSTRTAYLAFFVRQTELPAAQQVQESFAPLKNKFFGWLAVQGHCWTADHLQRRGLPNQGLCPLCEQFAEDINHLLLQCSFSHLVRYKVLGLSGAVILANWWPDTAGRVVAKS